MPVKRKYNKDELKADVSGCPSASWTISRKATGLNGC